MMIGNIAPNNKSLTILDIAEMRKYFILFIIKDYAKYDLIITSYNPIVCLFT